MDLEKLGQYSIPFKGLKEGNHFYEFDIQDDFFNHVEGAIVEGGDLKVDITLEKQSAMMVLHFKIEGTVRQICDRCLGEFNQQIENQAKVIVKFGEELKEETDEIMVISESETQINVAHLIYEFIVLAIPIRHVHPDDENGKSTCDPKMLEKLEELRSSHHDEGKDDTDSRWDELKKLIGK